MVVLVGCFLCQPCGERGDRDESTGKGCALKAVEAARVGRRKRNHRVYP